MGFKRASAYLSRKDVVINPAKYRHYITIRDAVGEASRNAFGERDGSAAVFCQVWAEKQDWSGSESPYVERETPLVYTRFIIRWRNDIKPSMGVEYDGDVYDVESVLDMNGTRRELTLFCKRVDA